MGTEVTCEWRNMTHTHSWTLASSSNYVASIADPEQEEEAPRLATKRFHS